MMAQKLYCFKGKQVNLEGKLEKKCRYLKFVHLYSVTKGLLLLHLGQRQTKSPHLLKICSFMLNSLILWEVTLKTPKQEHFFFFNQNTVLLGLLPIIRATTSQPLGAWSGDMASDPDLEQSGGKGQRTRRGLGTWGLSQLLVRWETSELESVGKRRGQAGRGWKASVHPHPKTPFWGWTWHTIQVSRRSGTD